MAPTIHLVRHAQGYHNLSLENESLHDPDLTPLGESQCQALRSAFAHHTHITKLVASPLRRTLYTALLAFGTDELVPITAIDSLQEVSTSPCDVGTPPASLREEFGAKVDLAGVREDFTDKGETSVFEPTVGKLMARGREARRAIRSIAGDGDEHVVVVSHGAFLHFLTDDWHGIPSQSATGWANCECRSYQFVDATGQDEDAALRETEDSWAKRQGVTTRPTLMEQGEMRSIVQKRVVPHLKVVA